MVVFFILFVTLSSVSVHNLIKYTNRLPSEKNQCWQNPQLFLYSVISGLNMLTQGEPRLCVSICVCLSMCVSVCVSVTASHFHNSWSILM